MQPKKANKNGVQYAHPPHVQERVETLKTFRRWITHEILPSIRENGIYMTFAAHQRIRAEVAENLAEFERKKRAESVVVDV